MGASDKESLIENEEQKEATTVDTPKSKSKEEPKPKEEEESFWGFAVKVKTFIKCYSKVFQSTHFVTI